MVTEKTIYEDIAERTGGDIYVGVVGPVRTGKSTFIKRFMESLVLPEINSEFDRERARDEMPQSAAGRTVMTTEPKFVPDEAVSVMLGGSAEAKVRLIDCVGYIVPEALGHIEDGSPRMVMTPWSPAPMPFEQAAEFGTKKVISDHSTICVLVTDRRKHKRHSALFIRRKRSKSRRRAARTRKAFCDSSQLRASRERGIDTSCARARRKIRRPRRTSRLSAT